MAKKTIAVVGATGAQGGGLVRAILADPAGGFSARAITRNVSSDKAKALAKAGAEVVRRLLCHLLLGPLLRREGAGPGPHHGPGGEGGRRQARDLVDARPHPQVAADHRRAHAHAAGQVQRATLRRQGRGVVHNAVTPEVYRGFGFPGADELGNMFQIKADFEKEYCGARDLNKERIPLG